MTIAVKISVTKYLSNFFCFASSNSFSDVITSSINLTFIVSNVCLNSSKFIYKPSTPINSKPHQPHKGLRCSHVLIRHVLGVAKRLLYPRDNKSKTIRLFFRSPSTCQCLRFFNLALVHAFLNQISRFNCVFFSISPYKVKPLVRLNIVLRYSLPRAVL